jgi:hypothetical protein
MFAERFRQNLLERLAVGWLFEQPHPGHATVQNVEDQYSRSNSGCKGIPGWRPGGGATMSGRRRACYHGRGRGHSRTRSGAA